MDLKKAPPTQEYKQEVSFNQFKYQHTGLKKKKEKSTSTQGKTYRVCNRKSSNSKTTKNRIRDPDHLVTLSILSKNNKMQQIPWMMRTITGKTLFCTDHQQNEPDKSG